MLDQHAVEARGRDLGLKIPRNAVTLSGHGRSWLTIQAADLRVGDVIAGLGVVHTVSLKPPRLGPGGSKVIVAIEAGDSNAKEYDSMTPVKAFVKM
jgi:hypothetical protein